MLKDKKATATLPATDLERAKKFYTEKLGLDVVMVSPGMIMVGAGGGTMVGLYERPTGTKADHTAIGFDVDNVESEVEELKSKGVTFEEYDMPDMGIKTVDGIATMGDWKAAWFKDTEGNILSINQM